VEYGLLQKAVQNKGGKGYKRIIDQKRLDAVIAFRSIVADLCRMECASCLAGVGWRSSIAMHCVDRLSWVVERVGFLERMVDNSGIKISPQFKFC
jgi:hypothetical protein